MFSFFAIVGFALHAAGMPGLAAFCGWSSVFPGAAQAALFAVLGQGGAKFPV